MARLLVYIATQLKSVQANKSYLQELYGTSPIGRCSPHQWLTSLIISVAMVTALCQRKNEIIRVLRYNDCASTRCDIINSNKVCVVAPPVGTTRH